jgi:ParB family chromosome partitioning protein
VILKICFNLQTKKRKEFMMAIKSFAEKIKDDFKTPAIEDREAVSRARPKAFPGARLIPLSEVSPDPDQPRKKFDQKKLEELIGSVKSKGVIDPVTVRPIEDEDGYKIITGERRYKAALQAELQEIPCIVKEVSDEEALTLQLIENLQREDLSLIDESAALKRLLDKGYTQAKLAEMIGKSQPYISQALKILDVPKNILEEAKELDLTKEHMLQLLKAKDPGEVWKQVKSGSTAEQVKEAVKKEKPSKGRPKIKPWTWKPEDKSFIVSIKFKQANFETQEIIQALEKLVEQLRKDLKR